MEMLEKVFEVFATHSLALGVGVLSGLIMENVLQPTTKLRRKIASLLGKAEEAIDE